MCKPSLSKSTVSMCSCVCLTNVGSFPRPRLATHGYFLLLTKSTANEYNLLVRRRLQKTDWFVENRKYFCIFLVKIISNASQFKT